MIWISRAARFASSHSHQDRTNNAIGQLPITVIETYDNFRNPQTRWQ
jgi:hypothetical protein